MSTDLLALLIAAIKAAPTPVSLTPAQRAATRDAIIANVSADADLRAVLDAGQRLAEVERERDAARSAADWFAHNAPGTPVPDWIDAAMSIPLRVETCEDYAAPAPPDGSTEAKEQPRD